MDDLLNELMTRKKYLTEVFGLISNVDEKKEMLTLYPGKDTIFPTAFGRIELEPTSIFTSIVKVCFRTFLECVRLVTFGNSGYQQIQLNLHYLRTTLEHFKLIDDRKSLSELIEEILTSAEERTSNPNALDNNSIDRICTLKLRNYIESL